jgi:hypothetical protein
MKANLKMTMRWLLGLLALALLWFYLQLCYTRYFEYDPLVQIGCISSEPVILAWACEYGLRYNTLTPSAIKEINANGGAHYALMPDSKNIKKAEELLVLFLQKGVDINSINPSSGSTSLHLIASLDGNAALVRLLLKHGARTDIRDKWGHTPLDSARFMDKKFPGNPGRKEIIIILEGKNKKLL